MHLRLTSAFCRLGSTQRGAVLFGLVPDESHDLTHSIAGLDFLSLVIQMDAARALDSNSLLVVQGEVKTAVPWPAEELNFP